jgi:sugar phosphate isomerase/epimerase
MMRPGLAFPNPLAAALSDVSVLAETGAQGLVVRPSAFVDDAFALTVSPDEIAGAFESGRMELVAVWAHQPLIAGGDASAGSAHLRSCLDLADALREYAPPQSMPLVVFEGGSYEPGQKEAAYGALVAALKDLGPYAEERQVVLGLRPDRASPVDRSRAAAKLLSEVGSSYLQIAFDAAATVGDKDTLDEAVERLKDNIVVAFARDVKFDAEGTPEYLPPGEGMLDYDRYVSLLAGAPGCGFFVVGELTDAQALKDAAAKVRGFVAG